MTRTNSRVILLNGEQPKKGGHSATPEEVANIVLEATGPLALAFEEMKAKVARLEDQLGITDASVPSGGDVE